METAVTHGLESIVEIGRMQRDLAKMLVDMTKLLLRMEDKLDDITSRLARLEERAGSQAPPTHG